MNTNNLIEKLSADVKPVRPLPSPAARAVFVMFWGLLAIFAVAELMGGLRPGWSSLLQRPEFTLEAGMMLAAGFLAALAAFRLSVPDTRIRQPIILSLILATLVWAGICLETALSLSLTDVKAEMAEMSANSVCIKALVVMMAAPLLMSFRMAQRSAPLWRGWAGYALTLSIASFGAFGMRFFCSSDAPAHLLLFHFLPIVALSLLGAALGRFALRGRV